MIAVRAVADVLQRLAAVDRAERARVQHVDGVLVARDRRRRACSRTRAGGCCGRSLTSFHVAPASSDTEEPAVLVLDQRVDAVRVGAGDGRRRSCRSTPAGRPGLRVISVHVSPPSVDLNRPLPGPPLDIWYSTRYASHSAANITFGFLRSIATSTAPVLASRNSTFFHVLPPSVALEHAALVAVLAVACRSRRRTRCRDWSDGCGSSRSRRSPSKPMCVQVLPASVDL